MMDLFAEEQKIFDSGRERARELRGGGAVAPSEYEALVEEYGRLLKQVRRATRMADKTTGNLFSDNVDLTGKVNHDALTGIYNRRFMEENLDRIIKTLSRSRGTLTVMMLDVDYFKKYNDTYGHQAGDECLKAVAAALSECVTREDDFVARYGGEEFVVVLPHTDEDGARKTAEKLLECVRNRNIPHEKNEAAGCVTVSVGVTAVSAKHTDKGENYLKRADEALYASKKNGRNRYTFVKYHPVI